MSSILGLWQAFVEDFAAQSLVAKISFLVPFLGAPTLGTLLYSRTSKARLRKAFEGRVKENEELRREVARLRKESFVEAGRDYRRAVDRETQLTRLEGFVEANGFAVAGAYELLAQAKMSDYYQFRDAAKLKAARDFALVAKTISPDHIIASLLCDETEIADPASEPWFSDEMAEAEPWGDGLTYEVVQRTVDVVLKTIDNMSRGEKEVRALTLARRALFFVARNGFLGSEAGVSAKLALMKAQMAVHDNRDTPLAEREALLRLAESMIHQARRIYEPRTQPRLALEWHYATCLRIADQGEAALKFIESGKFVEESMRQLGPTHNTSAAFRDLYARVLLEARRFEEGERQLRALMSDLTASKSFDPALHAKYERWLLRTSEAVAKPTSGPPS